MENAFNEVCKLQARRVTRDVMILGFYRGGKPRKPMPESSLVSDITKQFICNIYTLSWIGQSYNQLVWKDFLRNHFRRMTKTPYLLANYVAYASYVLIEKVTDAYACFVDILSLVMTCCFKRSEQGHKNLKNTCLELFCAIFEKELCIKFEEQGDWNGFRRYIENVENFKMHREFIDGTEDMDGLKIKLQSYHKKSNQPSVINGIVLKDITRAQVENHKKATSFANSVKDKMKKACKKSFEDYLIDLWETEGPIEDLFSEIPGGASGGMVGEAQFSSQELQEKTTETFCISKTLENIENRTEKGSDSDPVEDKDIESLKSKNVSPIKDLFSEMSGGASGGMVGEEQLSSQELQEKTAETLENIENRTKEGGDSNSIEDKNIESLKSKDFIQGLDPTPKLENIMKAKALLGEMLKDIAQIFELVEFVYEENETDIPFKF